MNKKLILIIIYSLINFIILPLNIFPQSGNNEQSSIQFYHITKAISKIVIDGKLDEETWKRAKKMSIPYEWYPGDNITPPVNTEVLLAFDRTKFYLAFRCFDPNPEQIRAHFMDRDNINTFIQDDHITFMIDTFNDERRAFQFRVNPLGVQMDALFSELEGFEDFSWDAIWESAGKITSFGYIVEAAIPFNQLRFPKTNAPQTWGFEAGRSYPRTVRHRMSSHITDRNVNCILCQFNKVSGFIGISPGKNLEFDPTLTATRTDSQDEYPEGNLERGKIKFEPGITGRWGINSNLILNATINPDFSQVEADIAQLEVNTRFALRYPEKRPFFLESADLFLTPVEVVFTRTIFDPLWGAKMTSKMGKNALGFFLTQDRYNNLLFPSNQESLATSLKENIFGGVFRYRRDIGKTSTIGFLYTGRVGDEYSNHVAGLDGFIRLNKKKTVNFQYLRSQTNYPAQIAKEFGQQADLFNGSAFSGLISHLERNLFYQVEYQDFTPGFRADYGFVPRVDFRLLRGIFQPVIWGKKRGWFDRIDFLFLGETITDHNNHLTDQKLELSVSYSGPLQSFFQPSLRLEKEQYNGIEFKKTQLDLYAEVKPAGGIHFSFFSRFGDTIDYSNTRPAKTILLNPGFEWGIGRHLNINLNHTYQKLSHMGEKIFAVNLLQSRIVYNFNTRTFIRAIIQYTDIDRNISLYHQPISEKTRNLFTQFLFSYKLNPQTVLFLGYTDEHLGIDGIHLIRTGRTFFLKIGYAFTY